jgi:hypothetical protein
MPAVTADTIALPRVPEPAPEAAERPVISVTTALSGLPCATRSPGWTWPPSTPSCTWTRWARSTTPPASPRGSPWHPHCGFETVTYMIDGVLQHQDSNGGGGLVTDGDTQWMTAGAGLSVC